MAQAEQTEHERIEAALAELAEVDARYPDVFEQALECWNARESTMRGVQWGKQDRSYCKTQAANPDMHGAHRITYYAKGYGERPAVEGERGKHGYLQKDSTWDELLAAFPSDAGVESVKRRLRRDVAKAVELGMLQRGSTPTRLMVSSREFRLGK